MSNRGGIRTTPRISADSSLVDNGRSKLKHREGSTLGDDVCGRPGAVYLPNHSNETETIVNIVDIELLIVTSFK